MTYTLGSVINLGKMFFFNLDLNSDSEETILRETGRQFHSFSPVHPKRHGHPSTSVWISGPFTLFALKTPEI